MIDPQAKVSFLKAARGVLAYLEMYGEKHWAEMVTHALSFEGQADTQMYALYFGFHRSTGGINTVDLAKNGANPHDAEQFRNMSIVAYRLAFFLKDGKPIPPGI